MDIIKTFALRYDVVESDNLMIENEIVFDQNGNIIDLSDIALFSNFKPIAQVFGYILYEMKNIRPIKNNYNAY